LDQYLENLIELGITKIIRIGGQSKSTTLANHNLHHLKKDDTRTRSEGSQIWQCHQDLDADQDNADNILSGLSGLHKSTDWHQFKAHVFADYPQIYPQFNEVDHEGFMVAGRHPFDKWRTEGPVGLRSTPRMQPQQHVSRIADIILKASANIHSLTYPERQTLIAHWVEEKHKAQVVELFDIVDGAVKTNKRLNDIYNESNRRVLGRAEVIGITTSGLANKISLLKHVACKVLICEEAGEIMEPHMISALLPTIEHCIQIGDHQQLRPSVTNFKELSLESDKGKLHQLDKSQFERLSVGELGRPLVPIAQLNVQRRMRPEISTLIRETVYPTLRDHDSTVHTPDVVGLRQNVFWLDHSNFEDAKETESHHDKSKTNVWEVNMVQALVRHIVRQGTYKSSDIAVLTPYTGQLQKMRAVMRNDFEIVVSDRDQEALEKDGFDLDDSSPKNERVAAALEHGGKPLEMKKLSDLLRVATVDNFQGEEAKVVIVSLVRSNKLGKVGFLKTPNRINVLLSRAKHGMYLIGNTDTYATVDMWQKVLVMLRAKDSVGPSLGLCCPRHTDKIMEVFEPDDFSKFSPEGGCREACTDRLDCGHSCEARCHSKAMHVVFKCSQPCQRRHLSCDHPCQKEYCGDPCGKCMIKIDGVRLPCEHVHNGVACHLTLNLARIPCHVSTNKLVSECKHNVSVKCSQDVTAADFKCPKPCETLLPCGHPCVGTCGRCNSKDADGQPVVKHSTCIKKCGRKMGTCSHNCNRLCHGGTPCGLCQKPCEVNHTYSEFQIND
jgi:hypothetical protein